MGPFLCAEACLRAGLKTKGSLFLGVLPHMAHLRSGRPCVCALQEEAGPGCLPCAHAHLCGCCRHERLLRGLADMQECQGQHLQHPDASALLALKDEEGLLLRGCHFLRAGWPARARWRWPDLQWQAPSGWRGAPISRQSRRRRNSRHRAAGHRRPHWILPGRQRR